MPSCDSRPARNSLVLDREEQKNPMHRLYIQLRPTSHPFRNFLGEIKSICTFDLAHVCNQQPAQRLSVIRFTHSHNPCRVNKCLKDKYEGKKNNNNSSSSKIERYENQCLYV